MKLQGIITRLYLCEWLDDWKPVRNISVTATHSMRTLLLWRRHDHTLCDKEWVYNSLCMYCVFVGVSIVIVLGIALIIGLIVLAVGLLVLRRYGIVVVPNVCQIVCACSLTCRLQRGYPPACSLETNTCRTTDNHNAQYIPTRADGENKGFATLTNTTNPKSNAYSSQHPPMHPYPNIVFLETNHWYG